LPAFQAFADFECNHAKGRIVICNPALCLMRRAAIPVFSGICDNREPALGAGSLAFVEGSGEMSNFFEEDLARVTSLLQRF
jgi:hypothetical protein